MSVLTCARWTSRSGTRALGLAGDRHRRCRRPVAHQPDRVPRVPSDAALPSTAPVSLPVPATSTPAILPSWARSVSCTSYVSVELPLSPIATSPAASTIPAGALQVPAFEGDGLMCQAPADRGALNVNGAQLRGSDRDLARGTQTREIGGARQIGDAEREIDAARNRSRRYSDRPVSLAGSNESSRPRATPSSVRCRTSADSDRSGICPPSSVESWMRASA